MTDRRVSPLVVDVNDAAEILSVHPMTVRDLISAGQLSWTNANPHGKRPRIRIEIAELERFIKRNKQTAKAAA